MDGREYGRLCREDITRTMNWVLSMSTLGDNGRLMRLKHLKRDASDEVSKG